MIKISASLMCVDYSNLAGQVEGLEKAGVDMLHFDIMDGVFVPNFAMSQLEVKALRPLTKLIFDVHLMIKEPIRYIKQFADAGADIISVHAEACEHLGETIQEIKNSGKKVAVALNPSTPLSAIQSVLDELDMILLMTVNPGFAGQKYIPSVIPKIKELRKLLNKESLDKIPCYMYDPDNFAGLIETNYHEYLKGKGITNINDAELFRPITVATNEAIINKQNFMKYYQKQSGY